MQDAWTLKWRRPPGEEELRGQIQQLIEEEVLYREGKALGLGQNDAVIRRRVAQKVKFLIQDLTVDREPSEAELHDFFAANHPLFEEPARLSFTHVYFSEDRRGIHAARDAHRLRKQLNGAGLLKLARRSRCCNGMLIGY